MGWYSEIFNKLIGFKREPKDRFGLFDTLKQQAIFLDLPDKDLRVLLKYVKLISLPACDVKLNTDTDVNTNANTNHHPLNDPQNYKDTHHHKGISNHLDYDIEKIQTLNPHHLYIILSGHLDAASKKNTNDSHSQVSPYKNGEILNLLALANEDSLIEIKKIQETTTLLCLDLEHFRKDRKYKDIHQTLINNMANYFSERLHYTEQVLINTSGIAMRSIDKQLEDEKLRILFGMFVIRMFIILCVYTISLKGLQILEGSFGDPTIVSTSMLFIVSFFVFRAMMKTHLPLAEFGFSTCNWKQSTIEGILFAGILFLLMLIIKFTLIHTLPQFSNLPLFEYNTGLNKYLQIISLKEFSIMGVYIIFAPVQEFLVRGGLQSSLFSFLTGPLSQRIWLSIIVSNLIFVTFHSHISFLFSLTALIPGIVWGWLYSRHKTLIGVSISHILVGISVVFLLGITTLLGG